MTDVSVAFFLIPVKRFHTFKHCRLQLMRGNCSSRKIVEDLLEIPLQVLFKCFFDPDGSPSGSCIQTSTQDKHRVKVIRMNLGAIEQKHKYLLILSILSSSARKFVAATLSVPRKRVNLLEHSRVCQRVEVFVVENATSFYSVKGKFSHGCGDFLARTELQGIGQKFSIAVSAFTPTTFRRIQRGNTLVTIVTQCTTNHEQRELHACNNYCCMH